MKAEKAFWLKEKRNKGGALVRIKKMELWSDMMIGVEAASGRSNITRDIVIDFFNPIVNMPYDKDGGYNVTIEDFAQIFADFEQKGYFVGIGGEGRHTKHTMFIDWSGEAPDFEESNDHYLVEYVKTLVAHVKAIGKERSYMPFAFTDKEKENYKLKMEEFMKAYDASHARAIAAQQALENGLPNKSATAGLLTNQMGATPELEADAAAIAPALIKKKRKPAGFLGKKTKTETAEQLQLQSRSAAALPGPKSAEQERQEILEALMMAQRVVEQELRATGRQVTEKEMSELIVAKLLLMRPDLYEKLVNSHKKAHMAGPNPQGLAQKQTGIVPMGKQNADLAMA